MADFVYTTSSGHYQVYKKLGETKVKEADTISVFAAADSDDELIEALQFLITQIKEDK